MIARTLLLLIVCVCEISLVLISGLSFFLQLFDARIYIDRMAVISMLM